MAVGANTYGTVTGIQRLIGDIVPSRTFGAATTPTITQVENELDNVAAEINAALDLMGYTVPISLTTDPTARAWIAALNEYGAAARLLATIPVNSYAAEEDQETVSESRGQTYHNLYKSGIKRIEARKLRATMSRSRFEHLVAGAFKDADGNEKKPLFTRRMDEYPGSRIMPSSESDETEDDD